MRYRLPNNEWDVNFAEDYSKNLVDIDAEFTSLVKRIANLILSASTGETQANDARLDLENILHDNLKERIDSDAKKVLGKADLSYVETMLASAVSGAPKGFYNTLTALQNAYPQGTDGVFLVLESGHIYIWNGSTWADAGLYQGIKVADKSITRDQLQDSFLSSPIYLDSNYDLNNIRKDGYYLATSAANKPSQVGTNSVFLSVQIFKSSDGNLRWGIQRAVDINDPKKVYVRKVDYTTPANNTSWDMEDIKDLSVSTAKLVDKATTRAKMADSFLSTSTYLDSNYDLNNVKSDGCYIVTSALNKPTAIGTATMFLKVNVYRSTSDSLRWGIQQAHDFNNPDRIFIRKVDYTTPFNNTAWIEITSKSNTKFLGKVLVCMGDSITYGEGASNRASTSYPALLPQYTGMVVQNKGNSGATWQKDGTVNDDISIVHQSTVIDFTGVDYVTIFAGTNDYGRSGLPIGSKTDMVENTLCGAINLTIQNILTTNPNAKIALITPMWRQRRSPGDNNDSDNYPMNGNYLIDYVNAIIEMAKVHHLPVLSLYDTASINKYNYENFLADGLHPNDAGYKVLAGKISGFLGLVY